MSWLFNYIKELTLSSGSGTLKMPIEKQLAGTDMDRAEACPNRSRRNWKGAVKKGVCFRRKRKEEARAAERFTRSPTPRKSDGGTSDVYRFRSAN